MDGECNTDRRVALSSPLLGTQLGLLLCCPLTFLLPGSPGLTQTTWLPGRGKSERLAPPRPRSAACPLGDSADQCAGGFSDKKVTCGSPAPSFLRETFPDLLSEAHGLVLGYKERRQIMDSHGETKLTRDFPGRAVKIPHP